MQLFLRKSLLAVTTALQYHSEEWSCPLKTTSPEPSRPGKRKLIKDQQGTHSKTMGNYKQLLLYKRHFSYANRCLL